jgi:hypothetical protein
MNRVVVQYKVKPDQVAHNEALIRAVYEELGASRPEAFRYVTFRLGDDDGTAFLHLASVESPNGKSPLPSVAAFRAFTDRIGERCEVAPVSTKATLLGSYRLFDD